MKEQATHRRPDAVVSNEADREAAAERRPEPRRTWDVLDLVERYGILVVWALVVVLFSILAPATFPTLANFQTILGTQAVLLIMTLGLLIPLTSGEFDLSVGATMGFAAIVVGFLNVQHGWPILAAAVAALVVGLAFGSLNAFLVIRLGVPSLVATLGTGTLLSGAGYGVSNSVTIGGIAPGLIRFATTQVVGLPLTFFYGVLVCVAVWYVFDYTPLGRYLVFVGEGREVARLAGLRVDAIRAGSLIACAFIASVAGVLQAGVVGAADPGGGASYLLPAFAGAFLGQTAIKPGRFNPWGTLVAVYFLVTGITGLELLGLSGWVQDVFYGGSLVLAVALGRIAARRRAASR
jgi:ribose transport system permease protein